MSTGKPIIIVGTGASAQVSCSQFEQHGGYAVVAFAAERPFCTEASLYGRPLLALEDLPAAFAATIPFHVAVGYNDMGTVRARLLAQMRELGFSPCSYQSPSAAVSSDARLGEHCHLGDGVSIQPFAAVGDNVHILSGCTVGHHSVVGSHSYICQHANINGYVRLGAHCFVGAGATLLDGVVVGRYGFIGAGAVVRTTMPEDSFYNPHDNTVHPQGRQKFAAWFARRQDHYAVLDH